MNSEINLERLADTFTTLCEISSPSRHEKKVRDYLRHVFTELGADEIVEDDSARQTGADCNNLIVRFAGSQKGEPLFFACHMDTVQPGDNVEVVRTGDIFTSAGQTILGGDDKSGIAPLIELVHMLKEQSLPHGDFELVFTTCEEIGLRGAKALNHQLLRARYGYALDSTGIDKLIIGAPAANRFTVTVHGIAAHAGMNPEEGISAFEMAAEAITNLTLGRIDEESTANLGVMQGGTATNIIPEQLVIHGEVRSHSEDKLARYTANIESAFTASVADRRKDNGAGDAPPRVEFLVEPEYPAMRLRETDPVVQRAITAAHKLGRELHREIAGGGSDANIFNGYGLSTAILATGMSKVHSTDEWVDLRDMRRLTEMLIALVCTSE
ncbi:MAG: M20/M25/M40 family metallo-hydrolase [Desulfofustis sp. PB-SRB1]|jgi:tripeptide aminopeptidase|nr:M20/M25/M40 family metallo-hydrolase [Desulfofustis sp. PB-SRB1]MBM1002422.1 M20/M25/M40 family metallo-hydrolase [Desulfofustis sp. PB-SRB1]HBH29614.1 peptidase M20 [Desulfofustis sp.]HBH32738.1 peptidase M20 [Desulfofustis sp.]